MNPPRQARGAGLAGPLLRAAVCFVVVATPLALGSVHEPVWIPLLALSWLIGLASWGRGHWRRAHGVQVPVLPGRRLLLALVSLAGLQLVPLPPWLLRVVSPGSFAFYDFYSLVPLTEARPITVSPADTLRGLLFLAGFALLYGAAFREFEERRHRKTLALCLAGTAFVMTVVALLQAATGAPKIYGIFEPTWDWAVFGPYVNRNHFAGYMILAVPPALALVAGALRQLRDSWGRRRARRYLALGDRSGLRVLRYGAVAAVALAGLLASQSRGGIGAFVCACLLLPFVYRQRWRMGLVVGSLAAAGIWLVDLSDFFGGFQSRGIQGSRLDLWADALRLVPDFPYLGVGFNAFATAYPLTQTIWGGIWFGEAHNDYLQALIDLGPLGSLLQLALLLVLLRGALYAARSGGSLEAGFLGAILASMAHALVDFDWQIPANAATFVILAGVTQRASVMLAEERASLARQGPGRP